MEFWDAVEKLSPEISEWEVMACLSGQPSRGPEPDPQFEDWLEAHG
jgi:hypothetical protein